MMSQITSGGVWMPMRCSARIPLGPLGAGSPPLPCGFGPPTGIRPNMLALSCGGGAMGISSLFVSDLFLDPPGRAGRTIHHLYVQLGELDADAVGLGPVLRGAGGGSG